MSTRNCQRCGATFTPTRSPHGLCPRCLLAVGMRGPDELEPERPRRAPDLEAIAPLFPELELVAPIGEGGMGFVYRARQRELGREVALKLLAREHADTPSFAERFRREARTLARLSHPGIVAIFDSGERGGWFYLLMEYVDGANLRDLMKSTPIESKQALSIVSQVCAALQYSHDQGVVHRDVKPENVLVDREGRVKIVDFGLARLLAGDRGAFALTGSHQVMGTPHYMAPEQWEKPQAVDHRADIYALGVVFYELLTGEMPLGRFDAPSKRVEVDVRLDDVVLKALEKQPERRYQRASEVQVDVDSIAAGAGTPLVRVPDVATTAPTPPTFGTAAWLAFSALGLVFVCAAIALWLIAPLHFGTSAANAWRNVALGLGVAGLVAGFVARGRLKRRPDYAEARRTRGVHWTDAAPALVAASGGIGLACAGLSKPNHPATEFLWLASAGLVVVGTLSWLVRLVQGWLGARGVRTHAPAGPAASNERRSAAPAAEFRASSRGSLVTFGLVLFVGIYFLSSSLGFVLGELVSGTLSTANGPSLVYATVLQMVFGVPCLIAGWHALGLSSRESPVWSRAGVSSFDVVLALFAILAIASLTTWGAVAWNTGTWTPFVHGTLNLLASAALVARRIAWWPRAYLPPPTSV
ncbi:MAG: serine/threonine protein kinase [Planctomycetes bacterium]|nr:serine/threonine protein kinase [Planctomycetota bacterium]